MRVLLVGNFELDAQQSMQRYAIWLERSLLALGHRVRIVAPQPYFACLLRNPTIRKYLGYIDKFVIFPPQLIKLAKEYDLVHVLDHSNSMYLRFVRGIPSLITCHDLLAVRSARGEFPESRTGWSGRLLQRWILSGLRSASYVLCDSFKTASDFKAVTGETGAQVLVVYIPLNWNYQPGGALTDGLRSRLGLTPGEPYFLHVGGNQWYKNRMGILRIFAKMATMEEFSSAKLILVGKPLTIAMQVFIREERLSGHVIEAVDISNLELQAMYCNALALMFISLEEGFGWPIVEAQACGCPVITSNRQPMTEVAGKAAIFVDPTNVEEAARAIAIGLGHREQLREDGFRNLARFDERIILDQYYAFYEKIVNVSRV